jgi:hypothetical protein
MRCALASDDAARGEMTRVRGADHHVCTRSNAMKELVLALVLLSPVIAIGYGYRPDVVQTVTDILSSLMRILLGGS